MPFGGAGHLSDQIVHALGAELWDYGAELCTLSVTYPILVFVPSIIHNLARAAYSHNGFHKLS